MDSDDLTPEQIERLFAAVERYRIWAQRVVDRCAANGFPVDDPLYRDARNCLRGVRGLALRINDQRPKGVSHQYLRRAKAWRQV